MGYILDMDDILDLLKQGYFKDYQGNLKVEKLFGQASARQYFRVTLDSESSVYDHTYVLMKLPEGFSSPAEEVTKVSKGAPKEFPFLNIQKYLKKHNVKVPEIYTYNAEVGFILLEDLGNTSFEDLIIKSTPELKIFYYKKALDSLVDFQQKTLNQEDLSCVAFHRCFDEDLLNWEFDHFLEYGVEDRFSIQASSVLKEKFRQISREITKEIIKFPQGLTHRDFQSRNLMFKNYEFYLIDFQDMLKGPVVYDLVALLRDSYIEINPEELSLFLDYYLGILPEDHPYFQKEEELRRHFHLMTLQRKLKDTGRFQFIHTVKNNSSFLEHVSLSLAYVKHAFEELPEYLEFKNEIAKVVEELR